MFVAVETAQTDLCHGHRPLIVTNREGYLASLVTEATGCGGHDNPWSLRGHPGQHIRLILYDFEVDNVDSNLGVWPTYVIVRETQNISISGQMAREQVVYTSASHILDISVVANHQGAQLPHFLLKYQGNILLTCICNVINNMNVICPATARPAQIPR